MGPPGKMWGRGEFLFHSDPLTIRSPFHPPFGLSRSGPQFYPGFFSCGAKVFSFRNNCPCYRHRDAVPKRHIRFTVTIATTRSTYIYADGRRGICGCFSGLLKSY